ncbi:interferon a3-like [Trichomycterus rosablanca]|uniref:interferon a3-like n=1 Tax=Trichomycterus rosablanca TaxID=2290929 RepID=UPI002F34F814
MNMKQTWTCIVILLFFSEQSQCRACDWIISQYKVKNAYCLLLLKEMGEKVSPLNEPFPHLAYRAAEKEQVADQVRFLAVATEQIANLFSAISYQNELKWDTKVLDDFLSILYTRQLNELNNCSAAHAERSSHSSSERRLRRHFKKLKKILQKTNYSSDALEKIRAVVEIHLRRMDIIAGNMKKKLN